MRVAADAAKQYASVTGMSQQQCGSSTGSRIVATGNMLLKGRAPESNLHRCSVQSLGDTYKLLTAMQLQTSSVHDSSYTCNVKQYAKA